ncbi:MAG: oligogalacturonate lyase family protein, partial [Sphingomonadales bacterium]
ALIVIDLKSGKTRYLIENTSPMGHPNCCPADPNLVMYNIHIKWHVVHRPWLVRSDGAGTRPAFELANGEGAGHEFWSENGQTIYAVLFDGRQPQGLWGFDARRGQCGRDHDRFRGQ